MAPRCSVRLDALLVFLLSPAGSGKVLPSRQGSGFPLSVTSAYRWAKRWRRNAVHIRASLFRLRAPPPEGDTTVDLHTLLHLETCFGGHPCALAAFQSEFQVPVFRY